MKSNPFVMNQLLALAGDRHQKDTNASIARSLLQHFSDLPDLTIQDAADLAYVSAASISRFVRYLGYSGFSEFKYSCRETLGIETDYSGEVKKARKEDLQPIYERFTDQVVSNIQLAYQNLDIAQLDRICQAVIQTFIRLFLTDYRHIKCHAEGNYFDDGQSSDLIKQIL